MVSYVVTRTGKNVTTTVFSGGKPISSSSESLKSYRSRGSNRRDRAISSGNAMVDQLNAEAKAGEEVVIGYDVTTPTGTTRYGGAPKPSYMDGFQENQTRFNWAKPQQSFVPLPTTSPPSSVGTSRPASVIGRGDLSPPPAGLIQPPKPESEFKQTLRYAGNVLKSGVGAVVGEGTIIGNTVSAVRTDPAGAIAFVTAGGVPAAQAGVGYATTRIGVSKAGQAVKAGIGAYGKALEYVNLKAGVMTAATVNLAVSGAATYGVTKGVGALGTEATRIRGRETYGLVRSGTAQAAFEAGMGQAEYESKQRFRKAGYWVEKQARQVPIVDLAATDQEAFKRGVSAYASERGLSPSATLEAAQAYGNVRRVSFGSGLVAANTFSEIGGQATFSAKFSQGVPPIPVKGAGYKLYWQGFKAIAPQGFIEGASADIALQASKGRTFKTFNYPELGASAVIGGVGAATLGGGIYSTSVTAPRFSRGLSTAANIADPYEITGDYLASTGRGLGGAGIVRGGNTFSFVSSTTSTPTPTQSRVVSDTSSSAFVTTPTRTTANVFTNARTNPYTMVQAPVTIGSRTPVTQKANTLVGIQASTQTNVQTQTQTNTNVNVNTVVNTAVYTTNWGFPFGFGSGGGKGGGGRLGGGQFKTYTPSLTAAVLNIRGRSESITGLTARGI